MRFKPYPKYKPSGVEWLGDVPVEWKIAAVGYRYEVALGKMLDQKKIIGNHLAPYLRNTDVQWGRINTDALPEMDFDEADRIRYSLKQGDLLVCEGGEVGRSAIWNTVGEYYYQKALHRMRPYRPDEDVPRFMYYLLVCASAQERFTGPIGKSTIVHLPSEALRAYRFGFPESQKEQFKIATFLDRETAKIDTLIGKQEKLVELLKEKRQAVISRAVTKGLDPSALIKDSGVKWLGSVPAHWGVTPIRYVARLESGHTPSRQHPEYWVECTIPWISLADVWQIRNGNTEYIAETKERVSQVGLANSSARLLPKGTVILSRTASVGYSAIMAVDMATTQDFANWVCGDRIRPEYLLYIFRAMQSEFKRLNMGSTHQTIYMPDIAAFRCPLPGTGEQDDIVAHIRTALNRIDMLIAKSEQAIALQKEHRTALISAAVSGKIDVRNEISERKAA